MNNAMGAELISVTAMFFFGDAKKWRNVIPSNPAALKVAVQRFFVVLRYGQSCYKITHFLMAVLFV